MGKLIAIESFRYDEYDKAEYYVAPEGLSDEEISGLVKTAQASYLRALDAHMALNKPEFSGAYYRLQDCKDDSMTIGEAKRIMQDLQKKEKKYSESAHNVSDFNKFLAELGIIPVWKSVPKCDYYAVFWDKKYGSLLAY